MFVIYNSLRSRGPVSTRKPLRGVKTTFVLLDDPKSPGLGLEVIVYTLVYVSDRIEKLIYISKADTTGLFKSNAYNVVISFINWVLKLDPLALLASVNESCKLEAPELPKGLSFISHTHLGLHVLLRRHEGDETYFMPKHMIDGEKDKIQRTESIKESITKLVLFTKPETQYLFPKSHHNTEKHLLNGEQLLKWWINVIENLDLPKKEHLLKFIDIVGADALGVKKYIESYEGWRIGSLFSVDPNDLAVNNIPLLPDDPKGRFLEHLVVENRIKKVKLTQFWDELAVRQEFRLGITVGLLGVSFEQDFKRDGWSSLENVKQVKKKEFNAFKNLMMNKEYNKNGGDWETLYSELYDMFGVLPSLELKISSKRKLEESKETPANVIFSLKPRSKKR